MGGRVIPARCEQRAGRRFVGCSPFMTLKATEGALSEVVSAGYVVEGLHALSERVARVASVPLPARGSWAPAIALALTGRTGVAAPPRGAPLSPRGSRVIALRAR